MNSPGGDETVVMVSSRVSVTTIKSEPVSHIVSFPNAYPLTTLPVYANNLPELAACPAP